MPLLGDVLPASVVWSELFDDPDEVTSFPEEDAAVSRAVPKRRREYRTVRHCARLALGSLGVAPTPILSGPKREPLWPEGVVGAMTHCAGYRGAAVARRDQVRSVGIDAEPHQPLPEGVQGSVATEGETAQLARLAASYPAVHWDRLLFCAKEATYKAWYPLTKTWLGFEDADIRIHPDARTFTSTLLVPGPLVDGVRLGSFTGRWTVRDGLALTAIVVLPAA